MIEWLPAIAFRKFGIAKYLNYTMKAKAYGREWLIPMDGGRLEFLRFSRSGFKSELMKLIDGVNPVVSFFDVGANCGQTLLEICSLFPSLSYHAFEPNQLASDLLQRIATLNNINCIVYPFACGDHANALKLYGHSSLDQAATVAPEMRAGLYTDFHAKRVASLPLDSVIDINQAPYFTLKIDVEGSENEVIKGAAKALQAHRPYIICEVLHAHSQATISYSNRRKIELTTALKGLGYDLFQLKIDACDQLVGLLKISSLPLDLLYAEHSKECDFFFCPAEKASLICNHASAAGLLIE